MTEPRPFAAVQSLQRNTSTVKFNLKTDVAINAVTNAK
jgi:hypothetical protein